MELILLGVVGQGGQAGVLLQDDVRLVAGEGRQDLDLITAWMMILVMILLRNIMMKVWRRDSVWWRGWRRLLFMSWLQIIRMWDELFLEVWIR